MRPWDTQRGRVASIVVVGTLLCAAAGSAQSRCPVTSRRLTRTDYTLLGFSTALLATDWLSTVDAVRRGRTPETNVLIGPHPSVGRVNAYMALSAATNIAVAFISKPALRRTVWVVVSAVEARATFHNFALGYHLSLRI